MRLFSFSQVRLEKPKQTRQESNGAVSEGADQAPPAGRILLAEIANKQKTGLQIQKPKTRATPQTR
jgi:hypothetical protein